MFQNQEEVIRFAEKEKITMIDLKFIDLYGAWHHITLPAKFINDEFFRDGVGFDGSSIPGYARLESGDMVIIPDPTTAFIDPFWEQKTLSMICDIAEADTKEPFPRDPRYIARRAEQYLKETGIGTVSMWGPEFEYYIFDHISYENRSNHVFYEIDSEEAVWNSMRQDRRNLGNFIPPHGGYHVIPPLDQHFNLRAETAKLIEDLGIPVRYHHHEVGGPGQSEIEIKMGPLTKMGDNAMLIKYIIRMVALKYNKTATFMPKPLFGESGNGMHFHQLLYNGDEPIFFDESGYAGLSQTALSYVAGLLEHSSPLLGLTNPSTNSYKRLVPGYEAPVNLFFSLANRSAAIRVPKYATKPHEKRIEFRPPDATCNIYLAMAAQLMAGIDGIKRKLNPSKLGFGPIDENIFTWTEEERHKRIKAVPSSLKSALEHLQEEHDFLLAGSVFSKEIIDTWVQHKMEKEYRAVRDRTHPYEIELYFNC